MPLVDLDAPAPFYAGRRTTWGFEEHPFSNTGTSLDISYKADEVSGDAFGSEWKNSDTGLKEAMWKLEGLYSGGDGTIDDVIWDLYGRQSPINVWSCPQTLNALDPVAFQPSTISNYGTKAKVTGPSTFALEFKGKGQANRGRVLISPKAPIVGSTFNGSIYDNGTGVGGGATTAGAAAQVHLWCLDAGTSPTVTVTINHSPDGTTWTPLISFSALSALGSQRIKLPLGTTVNQKVRASVAVAGTPTAVQLAVFFERSVDRSL